jgi:DNA-binding Lrp family transcriptional regulator
MSKKAYVMIQTEMGTSASVVNALRSKPEVLISDVISGPHDLVAVVQGDDTDSIARSVINEIQTIKGVKNTTTYMVFEDIGKKP